MDEVQFELVGNGEAAIKPDVRSEPGAAGTGARSIRRLLLVAGSVFVVFVLLQVVMAEASRPSIAEGTRRAPATADEPVERPEARGLAPAPIASTPAVSYDGPVSAGVEVLAPPPLLPRVGSAMVANDEGILVWGGHSELDGGFLTYNDGAFYDFEAATWTAVAKSPISTNRGTRPPVAAWSGDEAIVFHNRQGAAWSPETNTWRRLTNAPGDVLGLYPLEGRGLYAVTNDQQAFYRARDDFWVPVADTDVGLTGEELEGIRPVAIAWQPGNDVVHAVRIGEMIEFHTEPGGGRALFGSSTDADHLVATQRGDVVTVATSAGELIRYVPAAGMVSIDTIPLLFDGRSPHRIVVDGDGRGIVIDDVAHLDLGDGTWRVLPPPIPGSASAGAVHARGTVWRLGTSVDTDGSSWAFTRFAPAAVRPSARDLARSTSVDPRRRRAVDDVVDTGARHAG